MGDIGTIVYWMVQVSALVLFFMGAGAFRMLVQGCFALRRKARAGTRDYASVLLKSALVPAVTTIDIPPDASVESRAFARRLLDLEYGRNEVVIVLDGPTEADMELWRNEFKLYQSARHVDDKLKTAPVRAVYESRDPIRIVVVDKEAGGPVDAWNAGTNVATSPVIGLLHPESEFEPNVLLKMIQPLLENSDETVAMVGGLPIPAGPDLAARWGAIESLRAWMTRSAAYSSRNLALPIPRNGVLARRDAIIASGGFTGGPLELIARLHGFSLLSRKPYQVAFLPSPVSIGHATPGMAQLREMVRRDQKELVFAIRHRTAIAGPFGWKIFGGLYLDRIVRPRLETLAYVLTIVGLVMGWVDWKLALFVLLCTAGMGMVQSLGAVVLREVAQPTGSDASQIAALFIAAIPENLGYRQMRNLWLIADSFGSAPKQNRGPMGKPHPSAVSASLAKK
jgi:hypothetical protein